LQIVYGIKNYSKRKSLTNVIAYDEAFTIVEEDGYALTGYDGLMFKLDMRLRFRGNAPIRGSNREAEMNIVDEKEGTL
jgi:hypothetical protein